VAPKILYSKNCWCKQFGHCYSCFGGVGQRGKEFNSSVECSLSCFV